MSFSEQLLPATISILAAFASVLYMLSFAKSKPRRWIHFVTALVSLYTAIIYFCVLTDVISTVQQVSDLFRPAVPLILACLISERLSYADLN